MANITPLTVPLFVEEQKQDASSNAAEMKYQIVQIKEGRYRIDARSRASQRSQRKATATQRAGGRKEALVEEAGGAEGSQAEEAVRQGKEAAELPNQIAKHSWELEAVEGLCNETRWVDVDT